MEEPWDLKSFEESSDNSSSDDKQDKSNQSSSISTVIKGIGTVTLASLCIIWIAGNDLTVVGVADDAVAVPAVASFGYGMKLIFGM